MIGLEYFWMSDFFRGVKKIIYIIFILGVRKNYIYNFYFLWRSSRKSEKNYREITNPRPASCQTERAEGRRERRDSAMAVLA